MSTPLNRNRSQARDSHSEQSAVPVAPERAGLESSSAKGGVASGVSSMASVIGMGLAAQSGSLDGLQAFAAVPEGDDVLPGTGEKSLSSARAAKSTAVDGALGAADAEFSHASEVPGESLSVEASDLSESGEGEAEVADDAEILFRSETLEDVAQVKEPQQHSEQPDQVVASEPLKVAASETESNQAGTPSSLVSDDDVATNETGDAADTDVGEDSLVEGVVDTVLGDDGLVDDVVDAVLGEDGLVDDVVDAVLGDDGLVDDVVDAVLGDDGLVDDVVDAVLGDDGLVDDVVDTVLGEDGLVDDVVDTVLGDDGLVDDVVDMVLGDDGLVDGVVEAVLGDDGLVGGILSEDGLVDDVVDTVLGEDGLVGGIIGDDGLLGGLLGGSNPETPDSLTTLPETLVSTVSEVLEDVVDTVLGDDGLVDDVVDTVLGEDGLLGGVVGNDGLLGGLLGGSNPETPDSLTALPETLVSTVSEVPEVLEDVVDTVLGDDGLVDDVVDTVLGEDGLLGGVVGNDGLLGGLLGGSNSETPENLTAVPETLVSTVSEVPEVLEDVVDTVLGDDGLVDDVVDTVLGEDGLLGGVVGDDGLLGGLLGGSNSETPENLTAVPETLVSTVSEVPEVLEDVVDTVLGDDGLVDDVVDTVLGEDGLLGGVVGDDGLLGGLLGGSNSETPENLTAVPETLVSTVSEVPEVLEDVVDTVLGEDGLVDDVVDTVLGDNGLVGGVLGNGGLLGGLLGGSNSEPSENSTAVPETLVSTVPEVPEESEALDDVVDPVLGDDGFLDTLVGQTEMDALLGLGGDIASLLDASEPSLLDGLLGEADVFGVDVEESAAGADDLFVGLNGGDDLSGSLVEQGVVDMSPDGESYAPDAEIDGLLNNILGGGVEEIFSGEGSFAELLSDESDAEGGTAPEEAEESSAGLIDDTAVEDALNILFDDSADHHVGSILGGLFGAGSEDDIG